jgi:V8-like Glu-specific endopeptidase
MRLTADEFAALESALRDAYSSYDDLAGTLRRAGWQIQDVTVPAPMPQVVLAVIENAETRDRVHDLIAAARSERPTNVGLLKLSAAIGLEPGAPPTASPDDALEAAGENLERMVDPHRGIADLGSFAAKIQELLNRVCAVELGSTWGTGFLIGPDTILTNHHVVKDAIDGSFDPASIGLRFDFQRLRDGLTTNGGAVYGLSDEWLVHASPPSSVDHQVYDASKVPGSAELDYAVLRTRTEVGLEPPSGPGTAARGWLTPRLQAYEFQVDTFLMVVQHPCHEPISFDSADDAVIRVNRNSTRVHYRINTLGGSSGSPVLDRNLDLVALHHAGEPGSPDYLLPCNKQLTPASYNEGIPIAAIQAHLAEEGHGEAFGPAS